MVLTLWECLYQLDFSPSDFTKLYRWIQRNKLAHAAVSILTSELNSPMFDKYRDRIISEDPAEWDLSSCCCKAEKNVCKVAGMQKNSISRIREYYQLYSQGEYAVYGMIALASHYAGKAINISKIAAGHAMSYVLTSRYSVKHGQAAAVCLKNIFGVLFKENCLPEYFCGIYRLLSEIYAAAEFESFSYIEKVSAEELSQHINAERMKNFSLTLDENEIFEIYQNITTDLRGSY